MRNVRFCCGCALALATLRIQWNCLHVYHLLIYGIHNYLWGRGDIFFKNIIDVTGDFWGIFLQFSLAFFKLFILSSVVEKSPNSAFSKSATIQSRGSTHFCSCLQQQKISPILSIHLNTCNFSLVHTINECLFCIFFLLFHL